MATSSSSSTKLTLKLLIDTKREKVLFAETSKEVIDFLFNLLCLPLGTVIRLLNKTGMVGCLANLYQSVENMSDTYMQQKDVLLKPNVPFFSPQVANLLPPNDYSLNDYSDGDDLDASFYMCRKRCGHNVTCDNTTLCPSCRSRMNIKIIYVGKKIVKDVFPNKNGFVQGVVTYMVRDDLMIEPMSTISGITLLNKFNIKEVGALQEKVVELGLTQGVNLLKASLDSKAVLTSVFLKNNYPALSLSPFFQHGFLSFFCQTDPEIAYHEKVLFAETSKEVIDFLFNLLCLSLGTVIRLLNKTGMIGCLANLYGSVENIIAKDVFPNKNGFVQGVVTYVVMDDLMIEPMSTI
ncbi:unnamed protein product [Sphenostylis stenocarpa]|uniref:DUF674 domain-containing protein n=1 Tax=Sphenostylis stenocarpa TaxID=92480 RepID=A0AA87BA24_9FABA|nr:unnamed protein product [Sphenostylis stenocarpa]